MSAQATEGRTRVLAQIRESLGRSAGDPVSPLQGLGPRPAYEADVVQHFIDKMREKSATVELLDSRAEVGPAVQQFLASIDVAWNPRRMLLASFR